MAKKYCQDVSAKHQHVKQTEQQVVQMQALQEAANKQRALLLMSRIYVGSINFELGEESVRQAFSPFGTIKAVNLSWDSATMKHKGYAFVEYETAEASQLALEQMNGVVIGGRNIKVGRPNNVPQAAPVIAQIQEEATKHPRIYVASIHPDLSSEDVQSVFEAFGKVKKVDLAPDNVPGKHRGWGYIQYDNHKSAADAIASMNLFDLGGQFLRVGRALTPPMPLYPPNAGPVLPGLLSSSALGNTSNVAAVAAVASAAAQQAANIIPDISTMPMTQLSDSQITYAPTSAAAAAAPTGPGANKSLDEIQAKLQAANEEKGMSQDVSSLQQEESVSISGGNARLMLMKKLSRKVESRVLVLRNMVSVEDLDEDLEEEVTSECSKYGSVERVIIYQEKQGMEDDAETIVKIFVIFSLVAEVEAAAKALDGRWFGGRLLKAELYDQEKFDANDLSH